MSRGLLQDIFVCVRMDMVELDVPKSANQVCLIALKLALKTITSFVRVFKPV